MRHLSSKRYCHNDNVLHTILIKVKIVGNGYHGNRVYTLPIWI